MFTTSKPFSKSAVRLVMTVALSAGAFSALPGCTADEIAATALVIGAAAIVSDGEASLEVREHRHDRRERRGWDRHDGPRHDGPRHDGPGRGGPRFAASSDSAPFASLVSTSAVAKSAFESKDQRVINLAHNYNISHYAATYLVRAIVLAEAKDVSGVKELGLELKDFRDLYQGKKVAEAKVEKLGSKLRLNADETAQLVSDMSEDVQIEKAVRGL